jgi:predicted nucleotidyltransferase component of viral defense system
MGQNILTPTQSLVLQLAAEEDSITDWFYFTGGTALSEFYLHHRLSEDLDFFNEEEFDNDQIIQFINKVSGLLGAKVKMTRRDRMVIFELIKKDRLVIKLDFVYDPFKRLKQGRKVQGISVDSLEDIGANKLMTITQRSEVKDFVDLYFWLQKFTFWDLFYFVKKKFRVELDFVWIATNFLKINNFDKMPRMIVPLELKNLQDFFKEQAKKISMKVVEK